MEKRTFFNEGNPDDVTRAALFIFFMRTCYNGIYSVNRSGKLSVTFPRSMGQIPLYYNHMNTGRPWNGVSDEKFVSRYLDA